MNKSAGGFALIAGVVAGAIYLLIAGSVNSQTVTSGLIVGVITFAITFAITFLISRAKTRR